jgi:hypothetical protein
VHALRSFFAAQPAIDFLWSDNLGYGDSGLRPGRSKPALSFGDLLFHLEIVNQESSFWRRSLWHRAGGLDESLHLAMDYDLWLRMFRIGRTHHTAEPRFGAVREHLDRKSADWEAYQRERSVVRARMLERLGCPAPLQPLVSSLAYRWGRWRKKGDLRRALQRTGDEWILGIRGRFW